MANDDHWIYVDTSKEVGDVDYLKVFATPELADEWFKENDPEGVAYIFAVLTRDISACRFEFAFDILNHKGVPNWLPVLPTQ